MSQKVKDLDEILDLHIKNEERKTVVYDLAMFVLRIQRLERHRTSERLRFLLKELESKSKADSYTINKVIELVDKYIDD